MSVVVVLGIVASVAAVGGNLVGLLLSVRYEQLQYPHFTISHVLRTTPGLHAVAFGWQLFTACYSVLSWIFHVSLIQCGLVYWARVRAGITVALVTLMSVIHTVPLPSTPGSKRQIELLHYTVATSYALTGVAESYVTVIRIEPLLDDVNIPGRWVRVMIVLVSPLWGMVGVLMFLGSWYKNDTYTAIGSGLEFVLICIYGCYPLALSGLIDATM